MFKSKEFWIKVALLFGAAISGLGMHQAYVAKSVSKIVLDGSHRHNWAWATGWANLFIREISNGPTDDAQRELAPLVAPFRTTKEMTQCFSSIGKAAGGPEEQRLRRRLVQLFLVSARQADQVIELNKRYATWLPELSLMMSFTEKGSGYSQEMINLLSHPDWRRKSAEYKRIFDSMKHAEGVYAAQATRLSEKADVLFLAFLCSLFLFVALFFVYIIRQRHRLAQANMKKTQGFISNIIDSMPSILVGIDEKMHVTQWNQKAIAETGISAERATGMFLIDALPQLGPHQEKLIVCIQQKKMVNVPRMPRRTDNGTVVEDMAFYPLGATGTRGAVIRIDDATQQKKREEHLAQNRKMQAIGQLAGGVAHDFNNMLGGILGAADLVKQGGLVENKGLKYVDTIIRCADQAADLTAKLLAFGRKGNMASSNVDVHTLLNNTEVILKHSIDKKTKISVLQEAQQATVVGDETALQNIMINLSINASHSMPQGGSLDILTRNMFLDEDYCQTSPFDIQPGVHLVIEIRDTGCGIDQKDIGRVFEPFFTTKGMGEGTGLGLTAVYGTIQEHQGAISVYSEVDQGTLFLIYLPLSDNTTSGLIQNEEIVKGAGQTVLLVDDEESLRTTTKSTLESLNYRVILAENGLEAVEAYQKGQHEIDLVFLDMIMPEMNGCEAFLEILEIDNAAKVVITSGFSKGKDIAELKEKGLAAFIRKPYRIPEISQLLAKILKH